MKNTLFGVVDLESELISNEKIEDNLYRSVTKYNNLTVTCTYNLPSEEALDRTADMINKIAEDYVDSCCI